MPFRQKQKARHYGANTHFKNRGFGGRNTKRQRLDPALLVKKATFEPQKQYAPIHLFADFGLNPILASNIHFRGYAKPTQIQDQTIPEILNGKDVVGIADTGTGKTAAFLIPLLNKVLANRSQRVLIVVPTRELAQQIEDEFNTLVPRTNIFSQVCIGGVSLGGQIRGLRQNPHFVIGTPGRLLDLSERDRLKFGTFQNVVVDEFDRMLDMGFIKDVKQILTQVPLERQSLFFSATIPNEIRDIIKQFLKDPIHISVKSAGASPNVDQDVISVKGRTKVDVLIELLQKDGFFKVLVFGRTKWGVDKIAHALEKKGISVGVIHGDKSQFQRQRTLDQFKDGDLQVLVATDIASRGLHIDQVTHVINYDLPETYEDYTHRIGRTGRLNEKGNAITLID